MPIHILSSAPVKFPSTLKPICTTLHTVFQGSEGHVIELDLTELDFAGRTCAEQSVKVYRGFSGRMYTWSSTRETLILCHAKQ